jgi:hypothetical protein
MDVDSQDGGADASGISPTVELAAGMPAAGRRLRPSIMLGTP